MVYYFFYLYILTFLSEYLCIKISLYQYIKLSFVCLITLKTKLYKEEKEEKEEQEEQEEQDELDDFVDLDGLDVSCYVHAISYSLKLYLFLPVYL